MSITINNTFEIELKCSECGKELFGSFDERLDEIVVDICDNCLEKAEEQIKQKTIEEIK